MAYKAYQLDNGSSLIRVRDGRNVHLVPSDGMWTVLEDKRHRMFSTYDSALVCARAIGGDPDLPGFAAIRAAEKLVTR
jgi:hypothetical protein